MNNKRMLSGILLIAVSSTSYGLLPVFAKAAYSAGVSTYTLLFLRFFIAASFMFGVMAAKKMKFPSPKEIMACLILGSFAYVGQSFTYFMALNYVSSSVVSLLLYTCPALVMIASVVLFKEKVGRQKIIALMLALSGAFVIIGAEFDANPTGIFLSVATSVLYAVYVMGSSRVVREDICVQSSAFIMLGAAIVYCIINVFVGFTLPVQINGYIPVLLIALVSTVLAFWTFLAGMEKIGATTAALVSTVEPVVTVLASVIILSEPLTKNIVIGGGLVVMALITTALPGKKV